MQVHVVKVNWDTTDDEHPDGQDAGLPKIVDVPDDLLPDDIADWLSDQYGWCVNSLNQIEEEDNE